MSADCVKTQNIFELSLTYLSDCSNQVVFDRDRGRYAASIALISSFSPMMLIIRVML